MAANRKMIPRIIPTYVCRRCGRIEQGAGLMLCSVCMIADLIQSKQVKEPTFEKDPFRYAMQFGKDAIKQMLQDRWCDK